MAPPIELEINGAKYPVRSDPDTRLLTVLRDELGLTGTKYGCGEGQCGACTVLIGGSPRRSCQTVLGEVVQPVMTIEGLEKDGRLHPLQQAFLDLDAFQCAYCTSGMIISGLALLTQNAESIGNRHCAIHARQYLPLRNLSAHRGSRYSKRPN